MIKGSGVTKKGRVKVYRDVVAHVEAMTETEYYTRSALVVPIEPLGVSYRVILRGRDYDMWADPYSSFRQALEAAERFCGGARRVWVSEAARVAESRVDPTPDSE